MHFECGEKIYRIGSGGGFLRAFDQPNRGWSGVSVQPTPNRGLPIVYHGGKIVYGNLEHYTGPWFTFRYDGHTGGRDALCFTQFPPLTTPAPGSENLPASTGQSQMGQTSGATDSVPEGPQ
jgi:hypothetical protein